MIAHRDHNPRPATRASVMVHYPAGMGREPDYYGTTKAGAQRVKNLVRKQGLKLGRIDCANGVIWCWMETVHEPLTQGYQSAVILPLSGSIRLVKIQAGYPIIAVRERIA